MMSINSHLKGVLVFSGVFDLGFSLTVDIWYDVHKGSGSTLRSKYCQTLAVSLVISYLLDLCPNLWCNNSRAILFLGGFDFDFSFVFAKNACFLCTLCYNVTAFCWLELNTTMQKPLWKSQVCPKFINLIMENNWLQKTRENSILYNVSMKGFPLSSHIFILTSPVRFAVTKC